MNPQSPMTLPFETAAWERWAPLIARIFLAIQFAIAALFKILFFSGEVAQTGAVGVPLPSLAVSLALILEIVSVFCLLTGWKIRAAAFVLAFYVMLLAFLFYHNWADQMTFGMFVSHLGLAAALLYVSAFGARSFTIEKQG